jgi:hypothetical protein
MRFFAFAYSAFGFLLRGSPQLQLQARLAADQLVAFVVQEETSRKPVDLETFLPQCLAHVERLIAEVDAAYTDAQLESVLQAECVRGEEFPHTASSGFDEASSCKEFATKLAEARMNELETGSKVGYEEWCEAYFVEKAGGQQDPAAATPKVQAVQDVQGGGPEEKPTVKQDAPPIGMVIGLIFLVLIVIGVVYAYVRR